MMPARYRYNFLFPLLLVVFTFIVYARVLGHNFLINWDDATYVTANSSVHGFSLENIKIVFTSFYAGNYAPLQMLSYMLDYTLWGLWPGGFLLTNVALHTSNGIILYIILSKLTDEKLSAAIAAGLFLMHPVQVESVAWVSQRKNLLAMNFMLLSFLAYISSSVQTRMSSFKGYILSLLAFICSLLTKPAAVFFPLTLLLYDYCFLPDKKRTKLLDKLPFFLLTLAASYLALHSQSHDVKGWGGLDYGGRSSWHGGGPWATFMTMMPVLCTYLRMIVWPTGLSAIYDPVIYSSVEMPVIVSFVVLFFCFLLLFFLIKINRRIGFWPFFSVLAILPVVQIVPLVTLMNDRYLYFPMIGVAALSGTCAAALKQVYPVKIISGVAIVVLFILALLSFRRVDVWENSQSLWSDAVIKTPKKHEVWEGLGEAYHFDTPVMLQDADRAYAMAFALYSSGQMNLFNFARVKLEQGDDKRGMVLIQRLLQINPEHVMGWAALGDIHYTKQDYFEAEKAYKKAETLQPEALEIQLRLYRLYLAINATSLAQFHYQRFLTLGGDVSMMNN